jgi:hypothetical protein
MCKVRACREACAEISASWSRIFGVATSLRGRLARCQLASDPYLGAQESLVILQFMIRQVARSMVYQVLLGDPRALGNPYLYPPPHCILQNVD